MARVNRDNELLDTQISPSGRLVGIDALRGVAALAVVFFHAGLFQPEWGPVFLPDLSRQILGALLSLGQTGVYLFFVISGFCIHRPFALAAAAGQREQADCVPFWPFWRRRLIRLYPPYVLAMALYLVALTLEGMLSEPREQLWDIASHLMLVHNFSDATVFTICGAFWTLAVEEQLYLGYFLLLFLRRRLGWGGTLFLCFAARLVWYGVCSIAEHRYRVIIPVGFGAPAYWGVWALGALGVEMSVGLLRTPRWCKSGAVAGGILFGVAVMMRLCPMTASPATEPPVSRLWRLLFHPLCGLGFFVLINYAVAGERAWRSALRRGSRWSHLCRIGTFSYSLYLVHQLVVEHLGALFLGADPTPDRTLIEVLALAPLSVPLCYLFFLRCERPFLPLKGPGSAAPAPWR